MTDLELVELALRRFYDKLSERELDNGFASVEMFWRVADEIAILREERGDNNCIS